MMRFALLLLSVLLLCVCVEAGWLGSRRHSHQPSHKLPQSKTTNITKYGNNLCHECTNVVSWCTYTYQRPCRHNSDGELILPAHNSTNGTSPTPERRHDMHPKHRPRGHWRKPWKRWWNWNNNDFHGDNGKNSSHDDRPRSPMCTYNTSRTCSESRCVMKCCDGSPMNTTTNTCRYVHKTDDKIDSCLNGGTVDSKRTHCTCPKGFMGQQCENRKCSIHCQNGGLCQTRTNRTGPLSLAHTSNNDDYCLCPSDVTGRFCETMSTGMTTIFALMMMILAIKKMVMTMMTMTTTTTVTRPPRCPTEVCSFECQNNGTCVSRTYSNYCRCKPGFRGQYCEKHDKPGDCPPASNLGGCTYYAYNYECHMDEDCPGKKKCCHNNCHRGMCADPYSNSSICVFNNMTVKMGSAFRPDPCTVCTCNASHVGAVQGVIECARIRCPDPPKYCNRVITPPGACCPICDDDPDVAMCAGNYTYPYFANCPNTLVVLEVDSDDSDLATVNLGLQARDCKGDQLDVLYSDKAFEAGVGEENFQLLTATTARDGKGNFAQCAFHIRVSDPYPPKFINCPSDVVVDEPGPVSWEMPIAQDNVGLAKEATSRKHPGDKMGPGKHMVTYFAEDYEGNVATCNFVVSVKNFSAASWHHHSSGSHAAHTDVHGHKPPPEHESHCAMAVGLGVATSLIVLLLLALAVYFWRRQKKQQQLLSRMTSQRAPASANNNNGMTNAGMGWNAAVNVGPAPQYMSPESVMSPPMYSRTDEMSAGLAVGRQEAGELPAKTAFPE